MYQVHKNTETFKKKYLSFFILEVICIEKDFKTLDWLWKDGFIYL